MASKQPRVIVGVDFGTTLSGYAFLIINSANKEAANGLVEEQHFTLTLTHSLSTTSTFTTSPILYDRCTNGLYRHRRRSATRRRRRSCCSRAVRLLTWLGSTKVRAWWCWAAGLTQSAAPPSTELTHRFKLHLAGRRYDDDQLLPHAGPASLTAVETTTTYLHELMLSLIHI